MADVAADLKTWSTTAASNSPADATTVGSGLADNLQEIQKVVRQDLAHKGADIASAGTTDIGAVAGYFHDITGTTTITSFGTVSAGIVKRLKFEGALTLTHNASSLILPGAQNLSIQVGDCIDLISEGSGNWRVTNYEPVRVAGMVLLSSQSASASAQIDFTSCMSSEFFSYLFDLTDIVPATDGTDLWMRVSTDNGSTFIATGYDWLVAQNSSSALTPAGTTGLADTKFRIANSIDNTDGGWSGQIRVPTGGANNPGPFWSGTWRSGASIITHGTGGGKSTGATSTNAIRFLMASGNITSGTFRMYGLRK